MGRRRRASYAVVEIAKGSKGSIKLSHNLASNLRVRDTDKVKVVPLGGDNADEFEATSGDMALLAASPEVASSVTFSPVKDSLHSLELSEGGDELSEDEIKSRFLEPYLNMEEGVVVMKKGHTLVLRDDNRKTLEFTVIHLGFGEEDEKEDVPAEDDGKNFSRVNLLISDFDAEAGLMSHSQKKQREQLSMNQLKSLSAHQLTVLR